MIKFTSVYRLRLVLLACGLILCALVKAQQIARVEYFVDTDPGFGSGSAIAITPGEDVNAAFSFNINNLPFGFHKLYVRSFTKPFQVTENNKTVTKGGWSLSNARAFYKENLNSTVAQKPNIIKGEYFLDSDPGFGKGVNIPFSKGQDVSLATFTIDVTSLATGFHHLYVQFLDQNGSWSLSPARTFYKENLAENNSGLSNIVKGEYFVDSDPGFGSATPIPLTPGSDISNIFYSVDLSSLSPGLHNLYTRFQNSKGIWSVTAVKTFYNESNPNTVEIADVVKGEYFVDTDPGFGQGINIPVSPGKDLSQISFALDIKSLSNGFHQLFVRFKDSNGNWGLSPARTFYKQEFESVGAPKNITKGEYFVGPDPGFGKGIAISVSPSANLTNVAFAFDVTSLDFGFHHLSVRFQTSGGTWGLTNVRAFYKEKFSVVEPLAKISRLQYFIDTDPGFGKAKDVPLTPGIDLNNLIFEVNADTLALGEHILFVRAMDEKGKWGITQNSKFRVDPPSGLFITVGQLNQILCMGSPIDIAYTVNGPFSQNNIFTAQLSDANGSFSAPINMGTLSSATSGTIKANVPYVETGNNYRIRVVASSPTSTSLANNQPLSINAVPNVFAISGDTVSCIGTKTYKLQNYEAGEGKYLWNLSGGGTIETTGVTSTIDWTSAGNYELKVKYTGVCAGNDSVKVLKISVVDQPLTGTFEGMQPKDGNEDLSLPITLSWLPIVNATTYDIYIWEESAQKPATPTIADISGINYIIYNTGIIQYEKTYKWQIVARRACSELSSPIQTFKLRYFPDLIVSGITGASSGFSGQPFSVNWEVKNTGKGGTLQGQWTDNVYISTDAVFDPQTDIYLGYQPNVSELQPGESYSQTATFNLPQGISSNYYVFVFTNSNHAMQEADFTNNEGISTVTSSIQLTPPPDLRVTSIVPPNFVFSGQNMVVNWKVENLGPGPTRSANWSDDIYLSKDTVLNFSNATNLGGASHQGALDSQKGYSVPKTVKLPVGIFGRYYLYVRTDVSNQVYEHASENNNITRSDSINVILTPPVDLAVTSLSVAPGNPSNRENVTVKWRVENAGGSGTENGNWADHIYLSKDSTFAVGSAVQLTGVSHVAALPAGDGYDAQQSIQIPANLNGNYFVYVLTDAGRQIYEYDLEENNIRRSNTALTISSPDLTISRIEIPAQDTSARLFEVKWVVKNASEGKLVSASVSDRISYSADSVFNNVTELVVVNYNSGNVAANGEFEKSAMVKFPEGTSGDFYIYIQTDHDNRIFEAGRDSNNTIRSTSRIKIEANLRQNLLASQLSITKDSVFSGAALPLSYRIINAGSRTITNLTWSDRIYISAEEDWNPAAATLLKETLQSNTILPDSGYTVSTQVVMPSQFNSGSYYLFVVTDAANTVPETGSENDNVRRGSAFYLRQYPPVDLLVTALNAPGATSNGASVTVNWSIQNIGEAVTLQSRWDDGFYLSRDTNWNKDDDVLIREYAHNGALAVNQSYSNNQTLILPNGLSGTFYLLLVADHSDFNGDANRSNNVKLVTQGDGGEPLKLEIKATPPSDLVVTSFSVQGTGQAGQPLTARWTVKNTATGTTGARFWTERVYLSTNTQVDAADQVIGSYLRSDSLTAGQSYSDTLQVVLPFNAQGNYYILFETDAGNSVFEYLAEENNTASSVISVAKAPISDLIVSEITVPGTAIVGEQISFQWKIKNIGGFEANGYMRDAIYLSEDATRDVGDLLLISQGVSINIPSQGEVTHTFSGELKGASLRNYHVLVYTDILNNIYETNDVNNNLASPAKMSVTVRELPVNVPTSSPMANGQEIYYRIEVPESMKGETLLLTLTGNTASSANELYLRHGQVPTRAVYDFSYNLPFEPNQEIIVPELKAGTYYLLATGSAIGGNSQEITLLAKQLNFEIRSVSSTSGGNTGLVTIQINGSKFGNVSEVRLANGNTVLTATKVSVSDPTKVYATFDLSNAALGDYDVIAQNGNGDNTSLAKGFKVVNGLAENLVTNVITPPSTRPSNVISLTVQYTNAGNTDIINPVIKLSSLGGAPIGLNVSDLGRNVKELTLNLEELNGPLKVLRPGASGVVIVYAKALTALGFMLVGSKE